MFQAMPITTINGLRNLQIQKIREKQREFGKKDDCFNFFCESVKTLLTLNKLNLSHHIKN